MGFYQKNCGNGSPIGVEQSATTCRRLQERLDQLLSASRRPNLIQTISRGRKIDSALSDDLGNVRTGNSLSQHGENLLFAYSLRFKRTPRRRQPDRLDQLPSSTRRANVP